MWGLFSSKVAFFFCSFFLPERMLFPRMPSRESQLASQLERGASVHLTIALRLRETRASALRFRARFPPAAHSFGKDVVIGKQRQKDGHLWVRFSFFPPSKLDSRQGRTSPLFANLLPRLCFFCLREPSANIPPVSSGRERAGTTGTVGDASRDRFPLWGRAGASQKLSRASLETCRALCVL